MNQVTDFVPQALASLTGTGPLAYVLWVLLKRQQDDNARLVKERADQNKAFMHVVTEQQGERIARLEEAVRECNEDRKSLHQKLYDLVRGHRQE